LKKFVFLSVSFSAYFQERSAISSLTEEVVETSRGSLINGEAFVVFDPETPMSTGSGQNEPGVNGYAGVETTY
jgi:hypothetical protein